MEATLLLRCARPAEALVLLDAALARSPDAAPLRQARARANIMLDDPAGAAADAAEAVFLDPADPTAKALLGIAMGELGRLDDAAACLAEAVRGEPANPSFRLALSRTLDLLGDAAQAAAVLEDGLRLAPAALLLWNATAHLAIAHGDYSRAVRVCGEARAAGVVDACLIGMQGHALSSLGEHAAAADAYEHALQLAPEDPYVRHLVAASGRRPADAKAPDEYVRVVFDGYAGRFEGHLLQLGYRVPGLLRAAVVEHLELPNAAPTVGPVLDLGCGTGLAAVAMSDLPLGPWHGIDLSSAMLREAAAKGLYADLLHGALPEALSRRGPAFALAVAADMLCYVGDLAPVLRATWGALRPGALLVASLEAALPTGSPWTLQATGRYAHTPEFARASARASGFEVLALRHDWLRAEHGQPVPGLIAALRKPA